MTCTLTITLLGCHAGSGEDRADEENAMTAAEAQAFKRACSCFGLGRYLYNFTEMWGSLNEYRQPTEYRGFGSGRCPNGASPQRAIPLLAHDLRRRNEGRSIRRRLGGSRGFGAIWETQSMGRSSGELRMRARRTPSKCTVAGQCCRGDGASLPRCSPGTLLGWTSCESSP